MYQPPTWPTASGYNETTATMECETRIKASASAQACLTQVNIDMEAVIRGCVEDIQVFEKS